MPPDRIRTEFTPYYHRKDEQASLEMESSRRHCFCVSLVYLSALLVSVAMIVVGALYAAPMTSPTQESGCRAEPMIPWYLIFGGCLTMALVLGRIIVYKICESCAAKSSSKDRPHRLSCLACKFSITTLYDVLALVATALWLMAGTKFILGIYQVVNHFTDRPNNDTCDGVVFGFSFWIMIIGWVFVGLMIISLILCRLCPCLCSLVCCKPCREEEEYHV